MSDMAQGSIDEIIRKIAELSEKMDNVEEKLSNKIDKCNDKIERIEDRLAEKIDYVEEKIDRVQSDIGGEDGLRERVTALEGTVRDSSLPSKKASIKDHATVAVAGAGGTGVLLAIVEVVQSLLNHK